LAHRKNPDSTFARQIRGYIFRLTVLKSIVDSQPGIVGVKGGNIDVFE